MAQKTIQEIVNELSVRIVEQQALDWLRQRCLEYVKLHREWREAEQLCMFENNLYFKAVEKNATLRKKQKPPLDFKETYHRFATEYAEKPRYDYLNIEYLNANKLLQLLRQGNWDWQWQDMPGEESFHPMDQLAALEKFPKLWDRWRDEERKVDAIPDKATKRKVLDFMRNLSRKDKNEIDRRYDWLESDLCARDASGWEFLIHRFKDIKFKKLFVIKGWVIHKHKYILSGWTPPKMFPVPEEQKYPWPYIFHGKDRIEVVEEVGKIFRPLDPEAENDRLAMCLLLALVHDECDPEPRILTDEIKRTIPDWEELVPDISRDQDEDSSRDQDELTNDLNKAWNYVEADMEAGKGKEAPLSQAEREAKRGRKSKYSLEKVKQIQKSYQDYRKEKKSAKSAWNLAAKDHKIITGDAAKMACRRHLPQNK